MQIKTHLITLSEHLYSMNEKSRSVDEKEFQYVSFLQINAFEDPIYGRKYSENQLGFLTYENDTGMTQVCSNADPNMGPVTLVRANAEVIT